MRRRNSRQRREAVKLTEWPCAAVIDGRVCGTAQVRLVVSKTAYTFSIPISFASTIGSESFRTSETSLRSTEPPYRIR